MKNKNNLILILSLIVIIATITTVYFLFKDKEVNNTNNGQVIDKIEHPLIKVETPKPNDIITSPLTVKGEAVGNWFFEASFPVQLFDANYNEINLSPGYIMTSVDWMTTEFVPFEGSLNFTNPETSEGILILKKDNPSGLPEHDDELIIPVKFPNE